jgi:SAM-dependent methyltransferase
MPELNTQKFFDRYAVDFDAIYGNRNGALDAVVNRLFRQSMKQRFEMTIAGCSPAEGCTVLDIGCGPGHYSVTLAQRGAKVLGIDFAESMIDIAEKRAAAAKVTDCCEFRVADWTRFPESQKFDYVLALGFMDYVADAADTVAKIVSLTTRRAFLSFPRAGGVLGWQRKLRYRYQHRCELFLYNEEQLRDLFSKFPKVRATIAPISRDYFVTISADNTKH